jgi:hypothetical protein
MSALRLTALAVFLKELDAQLSFVRDAQGVVTAVVLHQNGQDATAPRVRM